MSIKTFNGDHYCFNFFEESFTALQQRKPFSLNRGMPTFQNRTTKSVLGLATRRIQPPGALIDSLRGSVSSIEQGNHKSESKNLGSST